MSGAMNETGFLLALRAIFILFSALVSAIYRRGVSLRQVGVSSLTPAMTITVSIYPDKFLIRNFYYTFVNIFYNFHTLKYVDRFIK